MKDSFLSQPITPLAAISGLKMWLGLFCLAVLTVALYLPGLTGGFYFDDIVNIVQNDRIRITKLSFDSLMSAMLSSDAGQLKRPISFLSFAANYAFTGLNPFYFKATNLAIHILTGWGLFDLTRGLLRGMARWGKPHISETRRYWMALIIAAAWLLSPVNLNPVLYSVQRMTGLSALFSVLAMAAYVRIRLCSLRNERTIPWKLVGVALLIALGIFSKENAVLTPWLILCCEAALLRNAPLSNPAAKKSLWAFFVVTAILPILAGLAMLIREPLWLSGENVREFSISERLLTESRVVFLYLKMILLPTSSDMGLFLDDISLSRNLITPPSTLLSLVGWIVLIPSAYIFRRKAPAFTFGISFFLVGHALESTALPLEIAHQHRNYLPSYGPLFTLFYYLTRLTSRKLLDRYLPMLAGLLLLGFAGTTAVTARVWGNDLERSALEVMHHPASHRSRSELAYNYLRAADRAEDPQALIDKARYVYRQSIQLPHNDLTDEFALLVLDSRTDNASGNISAANELIARLAQPPLAAASISATIAASECARQGICKLPLAVMHGLLDALLRNPGLPPQQRARVLTEYSLHELADGDLGAALVLSRNATTATDDPQAFVNYAYLLLQAGSAEDARVALRSARALDKFGFSADRIKALESAFPTGTPGNTIAPAP